MTPTPRKARSGRRQFGPSPGTDQEWAKVMSSPHVQRAFADPAIQQALMQHMQQQAALSAPPAQAPPPGMAKGGPAHFDTGGLNATEISDIMHQIDLLPEGQQKNNLRMKVTQLQAQQAQQPLSPITLPGGGSASMSGVNEMVKPPTLGNTAIAAGLSGLMSAGTTSHQGMSALLGAGLGGALSYLIRKYGKGAQKPGDTTTGGGGGNYTGGVTDPNGVTTVPSAQAWNKDWRSQASPSVTIPTSGPTGGQQSVPGLDNVGALPSPPPSSLSATGPPQAGHLMMGTGNSRSGNVVSWDGGKTWKDSKTGDPYTDVVNSPTQVDPTSSLNSATPATTPPPQGSADTTSPPRPAVGPDFMTGQQQRLDRGLTRRGPAGAQAPGWNEKTGQNLDNTAPPPDASDLANLPMLQKDYTLDPDLGGDLGGFAEGGEVEAAPPSGLAAALPDKPPIPVLRTTIVIAPKKAKLLPPRRGPEPYGPGDHHHAPAPHGRVQVPRGAGAAIKGKRFGGIY